MADVATDQFVTLAHRRVTLCVARGGQGQPLLVLGGTGSDLRVRPNPLQWPIAGEFDVLAFDHRGLGRSVADDPEYQPTMADFAGDGLALCDQQGLDTFAVIGVSFGGMVAQEVALLAGPRVSKLVLCCTSSGGAGGSSYPLHELYEHGRTPDDVFGLYDVRSQHDRAIAERMLAIFNARPRPATPPPGLLKQLEARRRHDTWDRLTQIQAPTLIAHGIYDGIAPPENSQALADRIPNARLAPFIGGHMFLWQDAAAWPTIVKFLNS